MCTALHYTLKQTRRKANLKTFTMLNPAQSAKEKEKKRMIGTLEQKQQQIGADWWCSCYFYKKNTVVTSENARRKRKRKMVGINYHHYHHHKKTADKQVKRQRRQRTGDRQTLKEHTFLQDTHTGTHTLIYYFTLRTRISLIRFLFSKILL